jgi:hypothetical protein
MIWRSRRLSEGRFAGSSTTSLADDDSSPRHNERRPAEHREIRMRASRHGDQLRHHTRADRADGVAMPTDERPAGTAPGTASWHGNIGDSSRDA